MIWTKKAVRRAARVKLNAGRQNDNKLLPILQMVKLGVRMVKLGITISDFICTLRGRWIML